MSVETGEPQGGGPERADDLALLREALSADVAEEEFDDQQLAQASEKLADTVNRVISPSWLKSTQRTQKMLEDIARPRFLREMERTSKLMADSLRPEWLTRTEGMAKLVQGPDVLSFVGPKIRAMEIAKELGTSSSLVKNLGLAEGVRSSALAPFAASQQTRKAGLGTALAFGDIVARSTAERAAFSVTSGLKVSDSVTSMVSKLMSDTDGVGLSARSDLIASLGTTGGLAESATTLGLTATGGLAQTAKRLGMSAVGPSAAASLGLRALGPSAAAHLGLTATGGFSKAMARVMGDSPQIQTGILSATLGASDSVRSITEGVLGANIGRTRSLAMQQLVAASGVADLIGRDKMMASWRQSLLSEATARSLVGTMALPNSSAHLLRDIVGTNVATARVVGRYAELNKSLMLVPAVSARPTRELRTYLSGMPVAPDVEDLDFALHASRGVAGLAAADILTGHGVVELEASNLLEEEVVEPWVNGPQQTRAVLLDRLAGLDGEIPELLQAAWDQIERKGPAAVSLAAHAVVETLDRTLRAVAPATAVLEAHAAGKLPSNAVYAKDGNQAPTRAGRIAYALHQRRPGQAKLVAAQVKALTSTITLVQVELQGAKHASAGSVGLVRTYLVSAEYVLTQLLYEDGDD